MAGGVPVLTAPAEIDFTTCGGLRAAFPRLLAVTGLDRAIPHFATVNQALAGVPATAPARQWIGALSDRVLRG